MKKVWSNYKQTIILVVALIIGAIVGLVFGEKVFIGKNINENWHVELFTLHFSNGNFTPANEGFNFAGLSIGYKF